MQSSARLIAILVLQSVLSTFAFAGDTAKPAVNPKETGASDGAANAPAPPQTPAPTPQPRRSDSSTSPRGPDTPGGELFVGYSYLRLRSNSKSGLVTVNENFDFIPGGTASLTGNLNWFGLKADVAGYALHDVGNVNGKVYTCLFGPQFSFRHRRFTPFVHTLVGGARVESSPVFGAFLDQVFFSRFFHQNAFAADAGGGLDVNASKHVAIRLF